MGTPKNTGPGTENLPESIHRPVMVSEILDLLQIGPDKNYVDGTLGLGGHAQALLQKSFPEGRLLGIDRDAKALQIARQVLNDFGNRVVFRHGTFEKTSAWIRELGWGLMDGMLLDLGVSSLQLNDPERGFSFLRDSALDMRMDLEEKVTARELLNDLPENDLEAIFREYGEERFSKRIAQIVVRSRQKGSLKTTGELRTIVSRAVPFFKKSRIHPATRVFQALRIAVNRELDLLEGFLKKPPEFLKVNGVLAVISFHSLEDRIVKKAFRSFENYRVLTKKPLTPTREEVFINPRARSAKLRAVQRMV